MFQQLKSKARSFGMYLLVAIFAFTAGQTGIVSAHGGDTSLIHACVSRLNGTVKIVSAGKNCPSGYDPLHWGIQGPKGDKGEAGETGPQGEPGPAGADGTSCDLEWRVKDAFDPAHQGGKFQISSECFLDSDGDKLTDRDELFFGTDPNNPDTDGDGLFDGVETQVGYAGWVCVQALSGGNDPLSPDLDNDTLTDADECFLYMTNGLNPDSDYDGINDAEENILQDSDNDGLADEVEMLFFTDPNNPDTDDDGFSDRYELQVGTLPDDSTSHP